MPSHLSPLDPMKTPQQADSNSFHTCKSAGFLGARGGLGYFLSQNPQESPQDTLKVQGEGVPWPSKSLQHSTIQQLHTLWIHLVDPLSIHQELSSWSHCLCKSTDAQKATLQRTSKVSEGKLFGVWPETPHFTRLKGCLGNRAHSQTSPAEKFTNVWRFTKVLNSVLGDKNEEAHTHTLLSFLPHSFLYPD